MIRKSYYYLLLALTISSFASCADSLDNESVLDDAVGESCIALTVEDYSWEDQTRTSATLTETGLSFSWSEGDAISIYPDKGSQVYFEAVPSEEGVSSTEFDGGAWKLKKGHTFSAFYPFSYDNRYADQIQIDYTGHNQTAENISDACQKDFIYATKTKAVSDVTNFQFKHLGAFMLLQLSMQTDEGVEFKPVTFTSVYLYSKYQIFPIRQELNLIGEEPIITNKEYSNRLSVNLTNFSLSSPGQSANVAMFMPAISAEALVNREIYVKAVGSDGKSYISTEPISTSVFKQGKAYRRSVTMTEEQEDYTIKILAIGNSFTINEMMYTPYLLRELLPKAKISLFVMYLGSSTINQHWQNANNPTTKAYAQWYYTSSNKKWGGNKNATEKTYLDFVQMTDWDYITLQQGSSYSNTYSSYSNLNNLSNKLKEDQPNASQVWTITHSFADGYYDNTTKKKNVSSLLMYEGIANAAQSVQEETSIKLVLPYGTAIQNARQTALSRLGGVGDDAKPEFKQMTFEGVHLQAGLPCLVACYTSAQTILDLYGVKRSIADCTFKVSQSFDNTCGLKPNMYPPIVEGDVQDVTDEDYRIAKKCALDAIYNPYSITPQQ